MEGVNNLLTKISDFVWGYPLIVLLMGTHIYLTLRLKFIQRFLFLAVKISLKRKKEGKGDVSQFGALSTALAATVGTGNIVGVATAVSAGGPGAILWMWLTGVFGIATKYSEALLSVKFRTKNRKGETVGGPMFVLERGLKFRFLGFVFAFLAAFAAFGIGCMVQANAISSMIKETLIHYNVEKSKVEFIVVLVGFVIAALTAVVVLGGIKWIASFCERIVPFMVIIYVMGCLALLAIHFEKLPETIALIFSSAFTGQAAVGGFLGAGIKEAMRYGIARGLFSNESGLGSAPIVAACAQTKNSVRQALVSMTGTFWDTVVICALTGLVLVNSGKWKDGVNGAALTKEAFTDLSYFGPMILSFSLFFFVFSTILGWEYYGEKGAEFIFGEKCQKPYRILWVIFVFLGSVLALKSVWTFADIANGLMVIPNVLSLLLLQKVILSETDRFLFSGKIDDLDQELE
ncbi:MAG: sodium:alanine symporter family protein [Acidobacteria bacterium]|nr:sodium:alanine symporter family protein [Acidobacteriota bacterium]